MSNTYITLERDRNASDATGTSDKIRIRAQDNGDGTFSLATTAVLSGDVEIGAVELKNSSDDTRAVVKSDGTNNALVVTQNTQPALVAGTAAIGKIITPTFSAMDSLTRPSNTTAYSAQKSINCNITVTGVSYVAKVVTLLMSSHSFVAGDRVTVSGVNAGATVTNVDGDWVIDSVVAGASITFTVAIQPTGTTPQTGLTITNAIAKMLSIDIAGVAGGGVVLSRLSLSCQGVAMTGQIRCYVYTAQTTVLVDQSTFTLLNANDTYRRRYFDFFPISEGAGSDVTFASVSPNEVFKCAAADTRLYFRLVAEAASTPVSAGVITLRATGIQLLG